MRAKIKPAEAATALTRLLDALEVELIEASDAEIMQAAADLGMNPSMQGSAAFSGLIYPVKPQLSDFFDLNRGAGLPAPASSVISRNGTADEK